LIDAYLGVGPSSDPKQLPTGEKIIAFIFFEDVYDIRLFLDMVKVTSSSLSFLKFVLLGLLRSGFLTYFQCRSGSRRAKQN
jgi:hypothetical protein